MLLWALVIEQTQDAGISHEKYQVIKSLYQMLKFREEILQQDKQELSLEDKTLCESYKLSCESYEAYWIKESTFFGNRANDQAYRKKLVEKTKLRREFLKQQEEAEKRASEERVKREQEKIKQQLAKEAAARSRSSASEVKKEDAGFNNDVDNKKLEDADRYQGLKVKETPLTEEEKEFVRIYEDKQRASHTAHIKRLDELRKQKAEEQHRRDQEALHQGKKSDDVDKRKLTDVEKDKLFELLVLSQLPEDLYIAGQNVLKGAIPDKKTKHKLMVSIFSATDKFKPYIEKLLKKEEQWESKNLNIKIDNSLLQRMTEKDKDAFVAKMNDIQKKLNAG